MLSVPSVFLRRPLSVFNAGSGCVEFVYRVIGPGTQALAAMKKGDTVTVMGPLGTGYDLGHVSAQRTPLLVAGGTGIASVHFLAARLKHKGILFYGARSKKDFICTNRFTALGWKLKCSTEDGSRGSEGLVTGPLEEYLKKNDPKRCVIYTCGPHAMARSVASLAKQYGVRGCASLEEMMACGLGNCQGCAVSINGTHKMVCKDGPVFNLASIDW